MSEAGTERVYQDDSYLSTMEAELLRVDTTAAGRAIPVSSKRPTAVR